MNIEINAKSHLFSPKINFIFSRVGSKYCYPKRAGLSRNHVSTVDIQIERSGFKAFNSKFVSLELKTLDWDILNPDRLFSPEIKNKQEENKHHLIWRLRKRGDQALISISTILKFSALETYTNE